MPSSSVRTFTDPDEYASAIRATTVDLTATGRGQFLGKRTRIDFHRLWMQRLSENMSRTWHSSFVTGRAMVTFRTQPGQSLHWSGVELQPGNLIRHSEGEDSFQHSSGPASTGGMSLPLGDIVSLGTAMAGLDLMPPNDPLILTPPPAAMAKLLRLHEAAGELAEDAPAVLGHPEAARSLEQALIEALMDCLDGGEAREDGAAQRQHAAIMRRFHRVVEEHLDEPLYMPELCKEVGASTRTLQVCCNEHLGMGAKHYLLLRRMQLVRHALRKGNSAETTVTEIATRYGFWQFGRFAIQYRALFEESPSATLARPT
jgi:AraC-like DNA-binding protein